MASECNALATYALLRRYFDAPGHEDDIAKAERRWVERQRPRPRRFGQADLNTPRRIAKAYMEDMRWSDDDLLSRIEGCDDIMNAASREFLDILRDDREE